MMQTRKLPQSKIATARTGLVEYGVYRLDELVAMPRHRVLRAWNRFHEAWGYAKIQAA